MYHFNENFFDDPESWTEKQAYWLGWYYSDGGQSGNQISFKLQEQDKTVLETLKGLIEYNGPLGFERRNPSSVLGYPVKQHQHRWCLVLSRKSFCDKLNTMGFENDRFPISLKKELYPHFLRGLYEGDGTFCFTKHDKFETNLLACQPILEIVQAYLMENGIESYIKSTGFKNGVKILRLCGNEKCLRLFNLLYGDATYFLLRKIEPFIRMCKYKKEKRLIHKSLKTDCDTYYSNIQKFIS